ncbi:hypothetical protein BD410DRAFT_124432 [Rickenella mellea]|uniref:Uncharacterized protein n=1 Tax=Rickenella mellea TaxID=50990 RepID=A0A4Y7PL45_9AGAM|nr:hypothetical protein BD410DRAFT_124432 [Rickenella mellea]
MGTHRYAKQRSAPSRGCYLYCILAYLLARKRHKQKWQLLQSGQAHAWSILTTKSHQFLEFLARPPHRYLSIAFRRANSSDHQSNLGQYSLPECAALGES